MAAPWTDLLSAAFGGGLVVKLLDYAYQEYRHRRESQESVRDLVDRHLDPILKASDELVGKLRSLANSDFKEMARARHPEFNDFSSWNPFGDVIYLFAQFWARVQILRLESVYVNLSADARGQQLMQFVQAVEASKTRIVDRGWQRGIGEALIADGSRGRRVLTFVEFMDKLTREDQNRRWFAPLIQVLTRVKNTRERQSVLLYGAVLHALIDTLDEKHVVTRDRPGWPNKLSLRSRRDLRFRVFRVYLDSVTDVAKYAGVWKPAAREPK